MAGFLGNSGSFVPYTVQGEIPPDNFLETIQSQIKAFAFRDIDDSFDEFSIGWVSIHNMLDSSFSSSPVIGDQVFLTMRVDQRKVAPKILRKFCGKEEERIKKERQIPKLNRHLKIEIKENMLLQLMKRAVPSPSIYDLVWSPLTQRVFFFSTSAKGQELAEEFFYETFGVRLVRQVAGNLVEEQVVNNLQPAVFI